MKFMYLFYIHIIYIMLSGHDTLAEIQKATDVFVENHQRSDKALMTPNLCGGGPPPQKNGSQSLQRL